MAEKDIMERHLVSYKDVFADIVNGCITIFTGRHDFPKVKPEDLQDAPARTLYKSSGELHEQERDEVKLWKPGNTVLCLMGLENQTDVDPNMALRVFGYEGGDYRWQLSQKAQPLYPVLTFVLYFGTERRWPEELKNLWDRLNCAEFFRPLLNNCHLNLIEVATLTEAEASEFTSDFRIIVDYLRQVHLNKDFVPSEQEIVHVEAVLQLLSVLTGDKRLMNFPPIKRGEVMTVRNVFGEVREQGIQIGEAQGFLNALFSLVEDGLLPLGTAAAKANMSEEEFKAKMLAQEKTKES